MKVANIVEKELRVVNGFLVLIIIISGLILSTAFFINGLLMVIDAQTPSNVGLMIGSVVGWLVFGVLSMGLKINRPNEARVFTIFGAYHGTVKTPGFYFVNPFASSFAPDANNQRAELEHQMKEAYKQGKIDAVTVSKMSPSKTISMKANACDNGLQKVNDALGNPITIGAVVIWFVENPTKAVFAVENYKEYISIQSDSAIRNVARRYPYDVFTEEESYEDASEKTLRGSSVEIAETMKRELQKRVVNAGLSIEDVRITHLAYAEEVAAAMLQKQQAVAIIAAKQKIVEGAVSMVKMAVDKLSEDEVVELDEEKKAAMVSNLLVVLCGSRDAQPVVNSGTIN
jgi:regulator of protease activity HflC (stomatin/prohibitin superfamily)